MGKSGGRSRAFWEWLYPEYQRRFKHLRDVSLEQFLRAINRVQPSEIRTEADEATYNLHILVSFEFEKELFAGELAPQELRDAWNGKMEKFLGLTPRSDRFGVLQDIHWPLGDFGYFPSLNRKSPDGPQPSSRRLPPGSPLRRRE